MQAIVYGGPDRRAALDVPDPVMTDEADAIVRVETATICGVDLRIVRGELPVDEGRILGHEAIGTVVAVGAAVHTLGPGDRVLISCISACGACRYCREGRYGQCVGGGGWVLGRTFDGTQADYVRVPFADVSTYRIPVGLSDEQALMLADLVPTGYEVGVRRAGVQPGDVVAVVGAGPLGLAAIMCARLYSPSHIVAIDQVGRRAQAARAVGADVVVDGAAAEQLELVRALTDGLGADVVVEAAGRPEAFEQALALSRPGGKIATVSMHGRPVALHLEQQWARDVTITTGLVDTNSTPTLLRLVATGELPVERLITHRFGFADFDKAYDVLERSRDTGALKVVLSR
jgi:alcohol dehydrogenase